MISCAKITGFCVSCVCSCFGGWSDLCTHGAVSVNTEYYFVKGWLILASLIHLGFIATVILVKENFCLKQQCLHAFNKPVTLIELTANINILNCEFLCFAACFFCDFSLHVKTFWCACSLGLICKTWAECISVLIVCKNIHASIDIMISDPSLNVKWPLLSLFYLKRSTHVFWKREALFWPQISFLGSCWCLYDP